MASSDSTQISTLVDLIQIINPASSLDIGCGYGKYGFLTKEYLMGHVWDKNKVIVNAVEGYGEYISDVHRMIYNDIFICDAMNFDKYLLRQYDLVTIIDAFEHLSVKNGETFIKAVLNNTKYLLISVPRYVSNQQGLTSDPNKFEEHRAFWTRRMFKKLGNCIVIPNNARKTIILFSKDGTFTPKIEKFCTKKLISKFTPYIFVDFANFVSWFLNKNNPELFIKKSKL